MAAHELQLWHSHSVETEGCEKTKTDRHGRNMVVESKATGEWLIGQRPPNSGCVLFFRANTYVKKGVFFGEGCFLPFYFIG